MEIRKTLRLWQVFAAMLSVFFSHPVFAANGCSTYSNYGGNGGKTWFNEYYFGPAATHFLEVFSRNSAVNQSNQSVWNNWHIRVYSRSGNAIVSTTHTLNSNTTACTVSGGRTYLTYANPLVTLNHNDAMVVVFDGPPDNSNTKEIDALVFSNTSPPTPYNNSEKFYTPTCPALKSALDSQLSSASGKQSYKGQNMLILGNFGTKDMARLPDGVGGWDETSQSGSGTVFTQCITNDPVDLIKTFTWPSISTTPMSSGTVPPGAVVTFTITAKNKTSAAMTGVQVSDTLPNGLTYSGNLVVSSGATATCSGTPTTCVLNAPSPLAAGATAWMSFRATVSDSPSFAGTTIQNTAIQTGGTTLTPPPSADAYITVATGATATGFNACHNFATSNCSKSGGRLFTRLVGAPFTMDIVALKANGTVETNYVGQGGAAKKAKVDLLNGDNANSIVATQNIEFPAGDTTGRVTASWPALMTAYRKIQVQITEIDGTQPLSDISSDTFSVRPSAITLATNASAASAVNNSTPVIKAGTPFTVTASTSPAAGYSGTITVDKTKLSTGNVQVGNLYLAGTTTNFSVQANAASSNNASYDEVGYLNAHAGAFRDNTFTLVDQNVPAGCNPAATCDCISSSVNNNNLADALVGSTGRYGCHIGNKATVSFARFIPDHFAVNPAPVFTPGHATCSFTYMDQPFTLSATIEARNFAGTKTRNYDGAFATGVVQVQMENANNGVPIADTRLNRPGTQSWSQGSYLFSADKFTRLALPDGPYDSLAIGLSVNDVNAPFAILRNRDMDSLTMACTPDAANTSNGTCTAVNLIPTSTKTTQMRFGRLRLFNAYGSELLPLPIRMRTEYFTTTAGFVTHTLDSCTIISPGNIQLKNHVPGNFANSMKATNVQSGVTFNNGKGTLLLAKPDPRPTAKSSVTICVDLGADTPATCTASSSANMPWLQGKWSETNYDDDPSANATFGIYKSGPIIYMREMY